MRVMPGEEGLPNRVVELFRSAKRRRVQSGLP